eukprot:TRINITY_DN80394_c0_g1_i1.p1 TRINITY_DN80394_c0_g1~~TRINITY_DN80394_c0_g1_i1.p1  ORF type:complete len:1009 (-),score=156.95 TRINITY_DN80394_c0_g1_i1:18-3044(-)
MTTGPKSGPLIPVPPSRAASTIELPALHRGASNAGLFSTPGSASTARRPTFSTQEVVRKNRHRKTLAHLEAAAQARFESAARSLLQDLRWEYDEPASLTAPQLRLILSTIINDHLRDGLATLVSLTNDELLEKAQAAQLAIMQLQEIVPDGTTSTLRFAVAYKLTQHTGKDPVGFLYLPSSELRRQADRLRVADLEQCLPPGLHYAPDGANAATPKPVVRAAVVQYLQHRRAMPLTALLTLPDAELYTLANALSAPPDLRSLLVSAGQGSKDKVEKLSSAEVRLKLVAELTARDALPLPELLSATDDQLNHLGEKFIRNDLLRGPLFALGEFNMSDLQPLPFANLRGLAVQSLNQITGESVAKLMSLTAVELRERLQKAAPVDSLKGAFQHLRPTATPPSQPELVRRAVGEELVAAGRSIEGSDEMKLIAQSNRLLIELAALRKLAVDFGLASAEVSSLTRAQLRKIFEEELKFAGVKTRIPAKDKETISMLRSVLGAPSEQQLRLWIDKALVRKLSMPPDVHQQCASGTLSNEQIRNVVVTLLAAHLRDNSVNSLSNPQLLGKCEEWLHIVENQLAAWRKLGGDVPDGAGRDDIRRGLVATLHTRNGEPLAQLDSLTDEQLLEKASQLLSALHILLRKLGVLDVGDLAETPHVVVHNLVVEELNSQTGERVSELLACSDAELVARGNTLFAKMPAHNLTELLHKLRVHVPAVDRVDESYREGVIEILHFLTHEPIPMLEATSDMQLLAKGNRWLNRISTQPLRRLLRQVSLCSVEQLADMTDSQARQHVINLLHDPTAKTKGSSLEALSVLTNFQLLEKASTSLAFAGDVLPVLYRKDTALRQQFSSALQRVREYLEDTVLPELRHQVEEEEESARREIDLKAALALTDETRLACLCSNHERQVLLLNAIETSSRKTLVEMGSGVIAAMLEEAAQVPLLERSPRGTNTSPKSPRARLHRSKPPPVHPFTEKLLKATMPAQPVAARCPFLQPLDCPFGSMPSFHNIAE